MKTDLILPGTGRGAAREASGGGGGPQTLRLGQSPLHQAAARLDPPPRAGEDFTSAASRLAGFAGAYLGWAPEQFWRATPAELASVVAALMGEGGAVPPDAATIARLREAFPDG